MKGTLSASSAGHRKVCTVQSKQQGKSNLQVVRSRRHYSKPSVRVWAQQGGGLGDEEGVDVAVFRFTLGIPGFEDRYIPRVVGAFGAAFLALNHLLGTGIAPEAQVRAEYLGLALAVLCVVTPEIEDRLKEVLPGRGRQRMAESIEGATNGLFLETSISDAVKQELAWSSSTLIKNTNICGIVVVHQGRVLLARGALGSALAKPGQVKQTLSAMSKDLQQVSTSPGIGATLASPSPLPSHTSSPPSTSSSSSSTSSSSSSSEIGKPSKSSLVYLSDRQAMAKAQVTQWATLPTGAACAALASIPGEGRGGVEASFVLAFAERPRALSDRERSWIQAVAVKIGLVLA